MSESLADTCAMDDTLQTKRADFDQPTERVRSNAIARRYKVSSKRNYLRNDNQPCIDRGQYAQQEP